MPKSSVGCPIATDLARERIFRGHTLNSVVSTHFLISFEPNKDKALHPHTLQTFVVTTSNLAPDSLATATLYNSISL